MTECPICQEGLVATRWQRIKSVEVTVEERSMVIKDYDLDYNDDTTIECQDGHSEADMLSTLSGVTDDKAP